MMDAALPTAPPRPVARRRAGAEEGRGPPELVDLPHLVRDLDVALGTHLLLDERHREEGREVVRPDRLACARVQHGRQLHAKRR